MRIDEKTLVMAAGLAVCLMGLGVGYFLYNLEPADASGKPEMVVIKKGDGFLDIANVLGNLGLVRSTRSFKIYSLLIGQAQSFQSGVYLINPASSTPEIVNELMGVSGRIATVTLNEGQTLREIENKLVSRGIVEDGDLKKISVASLIAQFPFLKYADSMEGFLFPDTYEFFVPSAPRAVLTKLLSNFEKKALPYFGNLTGKSFKNKLIIASMIEKEIPYDKDRKIVAGILEKRLAVGMPLQVDATVAYAKCDVSAADCEKTIGKSDFSIDSPYNTYAHNGLTPTPIGNPGISAILAAMKPQSSPYWYYLSDPRSKKTIFSETLDEHNENRFKYLNI